MKISLVCGAVFITVASAFYQPRPRPLPFKYGPTHRGVYGGAGGHGGGIDPLTLLLLQRNGGGNGGINRLLPIFLSGALGGGKKGEISPLLLTSLLGEKCVEEHRYGCTQPTTANANPSRLCGKCTTCCPCCTCPDTVDTGCGGGRSGVGQGGCVPDSDKLNELEEEILGVQELGEWVEGQQLNQRLCEANNDVNKAVLLALREILVLALQVSEQEAEFALKTVGPNFIDALTFLTE